jgi:O-antigen biosynthesis protein
MCNAWCLEFAKQQLPFVSAGGSVLEVGSKNVNGTVRQFFAPRPYIGVDLTPGNGVDEVVSVYDLVKHFGPDTKEIVISTEMMEHVPDWVDAFYQMMKVCKPLGTLIVTTRSEGFPFHGYPIDEWRFSNEDMRRIFSPVGTIHKIERDVTDNLPGVGVCVSKSPEAQLEQWRADLYAFYELYNINHKFRMLVPRK